MELSGLANGQGGGGATISSERIGPELRIQGYRGVRGLGSTVGFHRVCQGGTRDG